MKTKNQRILITKILNFKFSKVQSLILGIVVLAIIAGTLTFSIKTLKDSVKEKENKTESQVSEKVTKQEEKISLTLKNIEIEVNSEIPAQDNWEYFVENIGDLTDEDKKKYEGIDFEEVKTSEVGEYNYNIRYDNKLYTGKIIVKAAGTVSEEVLAENKKASPNTNSASSSANSTTSNSTSSNSGTSTNSGNASAGATTPTDDNKPVGYDESLVTPSGTWTSEGYTLTSSGTGNVTISGNGVYFSTRGECTNYNNRLVCAFTPVNGPSSSIVGTLGGAPGPTGFAYDNNAFYSSDFPGISVAEVNARYNVTINGLSHQTSFSGMMNPEAVNTWSTYQRINPVNYDTTEYRYWYSYDSQLRCNGTVVLRGVLKDGATNRTADDYNWTQVYY